MKLKGLLFALVIIFSIGVSQAAYILIPMDDTQKNHLKAYGIAYWVLQNDIEVQWLLNYRGGSFMLKNIDLIQRECTIRGVGYELIADVQSTQILNEIADPEVNMDVVKLEKSPKIAVYSPKDKRPWDDAVTLVLAYAEIPYDIVYDEEVLSEVLPLYDWLHIHHEDFTGQYGKFYAGSRNRPWYHEYVRSNEEMAAKLGFEKVSLLKLAVAKKIRDYTVGGGFLFAMCSATDSYDIALSMTSNDGAHSVFDGTSIDPNIQSKLDFGQSFVFENFKLLSDPMIYEFSDIDFPPSHNPITRGAEADYFSLFEFSAKYDPVPTMLTQNHVSIIKGFMGQTTGFNKNRIKKHIVLMGEDPASDQVKYLHGNFGKGTFTFYGGHDPEDYQHFVGDPPTDLSLHKNSPGYRLILNNILFPAARKKERKT